MATITQSQIVEVDGGNWNVEGNGDTATGTLTFNVYGPGANLITSGPLDAVTALLNSLMGGTDTATYQQILDAVNTVDTQLSAQMPSVPESTATPDQLAQVPPMSSAADMLNPSHYLPAGTNLSFSASDIADKISGLGGSFTSPLAAANMFKNIEIPHTPSLSGITSFNDLFDVGAAGGVMNTINSSIGAGSGKFGIPTMHDMIGSVGGGAHVEALTGTNNLLGAMATTPAGASVQSALDAVLANATNPATLPAAIAAAQTAILTLKTGSTYGQCDASYNTSVNSLANEITNHQAAGINLAVPSVTSLSKMMGFSQNLHSIGANDGGSGLAGILKDIAVPGKFGDAVKSSLAEGKNKVVMADAGIKPPDYTGTTPDKPTTASTAPAAPGGSAPPEVVQRKKEINTEISAQIAVINGTRNITAKLNAIQIILNDAQEAETLNKQYFPEKIARAQQVYATYSELQSSLLALQANGNTEVSG